MVRKVDCGRLTPRQVGFVSSYVRDTYCRPESVMDAPDRVYEWQNEFQKIPTRPQSAPHPSMTCMVEEMHHDWLQQGRSKATRAGTKSWPNQQRVIRGFSARKWNNMVPAFPVINWCTWLDVQAAQMRRDDTAGVPPKPQPEEEHGSHAKACASPFNVVRPWKTGERDRQKARLWRKRKDEANRKSITVSKKETESKAISREVFRPRTLSRGSPMWEQHGGRKALIRPESHDNDMQLHGIRRWRPEAASRVIKKRV